MSYERPKEKIEVSQVIKKSQFIGNLAIVNSSAQALEFVQQIKSLHNAANHSCHCFIAGTPEQSSLWGYSDDGEPKGTAGLPMFQVLRYSALGNVCIVVTRYFGGIKLGTGGIARAYSSTVKLTLDDCSRDIIELTCEKIFIAPFHLTGTLEHIIKQTKGITVIQREWLADGQKLTLCIEEPSLDNYNLAISPYLHELQLLENTE
ncbi:MAG: putative YigZ family protein [Oceanospirillaceae bacterium]|jgi:uncharacterized YigZ family protein